MPIYGKGLYYGSPTGTYKDAYVVPDSGYFPVFSGLGQADGTEAANRTGKIVAVVSVLTSLALFGLTFVLGRKE